MARRPGSGSPEPLGVTPDGAGGVNVAVFSRHATAIEVCLFDVRGQRELERVLLPERTGDVFHGRVPEVPTGSLYGLRAHGPYAPLEGHRFNPSKLLIDPYAVRLDRAPKLHPSMFGYRPEDPQLDLSFSDEDSAPHVPKAVVCGEGGPGGRAPLSAWPETVIYEAHVRGFTRRHPAIPEEVRGTFAGLAHPAAIDHLVRLGVTTLEVMPPAAWIEERHLAALGLGNYWGYNTVAWMAPDPRLAPGGWDEIAAATAALAEAGIETVVDVVLNHCGEGDELGPTLSLRGLDNASYYRLRGDEPRRYVDDTGCGDTLALDHPAVLRMAMDALRTWARRGGVSGFRFDLATTLGRRADGFDPAAPLLSAIDQDPELRRLKLIAEPWDPGPGGYRIGAFPGGWGEWNDRFRDTARRFWRGDHGLTGEFATRLAGSQDLFASHGRPSRSVNFVTAHDGFTLADLVAFERKHNEANGESNRDGTDSNWSWNSGAEGATDDAEVLARRGADQRALLATLLLARGAPMLSMGAETGQSQQGNNNAYAQDSELTWLDWAGADDELTAFCGRLTELRRAHLSLRDDRFLTGGPSAPGLPPDVQWRRADGRVLEGDGWAEAEQTLVACLATPLEAGGAEQVAVVFHRGDTPAEVVLDQPHDGGWILRMDSSRPDLRDLAAPDLRIEVAPRSVVLLATTPAPAGAPRSTNTGLLDRLAQAAGISPEWSDISGRTHAVGDDAKRALLAAMDLPAQSSAQARASLERLADDTVRRPVPAVVSALAGEPFQLTLSVSTGTGGSGVWLTLENQVGELRRVSGRGAPVRDVVGFDDHRSQVVDLALPALPPGRYRLRRDDRSDAEGTLIVAPAGGFVPPAFAGGAGRFGVAAHLYSLTRDGDQGIGDFTTLGELAEAAAGSGAVTVGLNPMHALFAGQRERASPYHPSDRRFLDPVYIDVARLGGGSADAAELARLRAAAAVDYPGVWALKRAVLEQDFAGLRRDPAQSAAFDRFVAKGGRTLWRFAAFEAISEVHAGAWTGWPADLRDPAGAGVAAFAAAHADRVGFHQYLQWRADAQLAEAAARGAAAGLSCGFYRDLAIGAAPDGAEAWSSPHLLTRGVSVGAPPDPLGPLGQVWGLPPPDPWAMRRTGCAAFAELLAANMHHAGALRIDHVMGLQRLFWVPEGGSAQDGAYVAYPFGDLLAQLSLESSRAGCMVVGEDLGTVMPGFRERMAAEEVLSYRVLYFERDDETFLPPSAYPELAAACVSTHDLPTLVGWWSGADIDEQRSLGLLAGGAAEAARAARQEDKAALMRALAAEGLAAADPVPPEPPAAEVHAYLSAAPSRLVLAQVDDLAGEAIAVNLPGTDMERPNWRRKSRLPLAEIFSSPRARSILGAFVDRVLQVTASSEGA